MTCDICGRELDKENYIKAYGYTLCQKHYAQIANHGRFLDNNPRSQKDKNEIIIDEENNCAYIVLYKKNIECARAIIDIDDVEKVKDKKWRLWKNRVYTGNFRIVELSYFVLDRKEPDGFVIDHKNSNALDNRKENLRIITQQNNLLNKSMLSNNTTGFIGMYYDNSRKRWCPEIRKDFIRCHLGRYKNREDAVYVRYIAEIYLFGEFRTQTNGMAVMEEIKKCKIKEELDEYVKSRLNEKYNLNIE